jgi:hypothetical protein
LSIRKEYELFVEHCHEQNNPVIPSEEIYRKVFCTEYNLYSFFPHKKDHCLICTIYDRARGDAKITLEEENKEHQKRKEEANASKARYKKELVAIQNLSVQHLISKVSFRFHHQMCRPFVTAENYVLII